MAVITTRDTKPDYRKIVEKIFVQGRPKEYQSTTEKFGMMDADHSSLVKTVEKTLKLLNKEERKILRETYFREDSVGTVYHRLEMSKSTYYRRKHALLEKVAILWGMTL